MCEVFNWLKTSKAAIACECGGWKSYSEMGEQNSCNSVETMKFYYDLSLVGEWPRKEFSKDFSTGFQPFHSHLKL